jgi:hypothetical protein
LDDTLKLKRLVSPVAHMLELYTLVSQVLVYLLYYRGLVSPDLMYLLMLKKLASSVLVCLVKL